MIAPITGNPASRTETESEDVMVKEESLGTVISSFASPLAIIKWHPGPRVNVSKNSKLLTLVCPIQFHSIFA